MKAAFQVAAFAATASAVALRRDQCCFQITATGGVSGVMGQLWDGQNRINGSYSPMTYCYNNGGIVDSSGRGCVVTYTNDATHQFQCDLNRPPTYGFTIASNGSILYQGSDQFYACPATDTEYNVYTTWLSGQDKCKPINLSTNGTCAGAAPSGGFAGPSGSAPGYSVPAYSSVGPTAPGYSAPSYTSSVVPTAPGYSAPAYSSEVGATTPPVSASVPAYSTGSEVVPGYSVPSGSQSVPGYTSVPAASQSVPAYSSSAPSAPGYSQPSVSYPVSSASESSPVSETIPGYGGGSSIPIVSTPIVSTPIESSPVQSTPVQSSPVQGTTQVIPSYPAESSSTPAQSESVPSYETTVTAQTTYYTTYCPVTETQVSSGSTYTNVYSTWSTLTAVGSSSTFAETTVVTSPATVPGYGGSSFASVPAVSSPVSTSSVVVPAHSTPQSTVTSVSVSVSSVSVPGYGSQSVPAETSESTTCTEETKTEVASTTSPVAVTSQSQASIPGYGGSLSAATTAAVSSYAGSSSTQPTTSASGSACQTSLSGAYQTPHLIVPVSSSQPNTALGTQYNATVNSEESTIFNFDIPSSYEGKTCSVIFLFPEQADLETSAYTFSGSGSLVFSELSGAATAQTTYDNAPSKKSTLDTIAIQEGNSYVVATTACAAGTTETIELSSEGGLSLEFFEDWNPSSLGLYITAC